jgi:hypothetical protein
MAVWQVSGPKIHFFLIFLLYGEKHYSCRQAGRTGQDAGVCGGETDQ